VAEEWKSRARIVTKDLISLNHGPRLKAHAWLEELHGGQSN